MPETLLAAADTNIEEDTPVPSNCLHSSVRNRSATDERKGVMQLLGAKLISTWDIGSQGRKEGRVFQAITLLPKAFGDVVLEAESV